MSDLQYTPITGPLLTGTPAEQITSDKWGTPVNLPVRGVRKVAHLQPLSEWGAVTEIPAMAWMPSYPDRAKGARPMAWMPTWAPYAQYLADLTVIHPTRSWAPSYPDQAPIKPFRAYLQRSMQFVADVTLSLEVFGWKPATNLQTVTKRLPAQPGWQTDIAPMFPIELAWKPVLDQQRIKRLNPPPAAFKEDKTPSAAVAAPDLAIASYERPVKPVSRIVPPHHFGPLFVADVTVIAPARSWAPTFVDFHPRSQYRPGVPMTFAWRPATFAAAAAPDLVTTISDLPTRNKKLIQFRTYFGLDRSLITFLAAWADDSNTYLD